MQPITALYIRSAFLLASLLSPGAAVAKNDLISDPLKPVNLYSHVINKELDRFIIRPASETWEAYVPAPVKISVLSFNSTWNQPMRGINSGLQGNFGEAVKSFGRFSLNATLGLLGFIDIATEAGLPPNDSDFADTLASWGVGEGIYLELPVLGAGSARDLTGRLVDYTYNPFQDLNPAPVEVSTAATVLDIMDTRSSFGPTLDGVLYESADSYEALKLITIQQSRRSAAGGVPSKEDFLDIYAE